MFRFQDPSYFYYFLLIPIVTLLFYIFNKLRQKRIERIFDKEIYKSLTSSLSLRKRYVKLTLELLALSLIIVSLARPQFGESTEQIKMEGIEIVFALDVSNSMLAEDLKPNRLTVAKKTIQRILERVHGYKVGLIVFAGSSGLLSPLTTDYSALQAFLESTNTDSISTQGTDFSTVIDTAMEAFSGGGVEDDELSRVTRVVVFLSDGEDHESKAISKVKDLVNKGVRIFTIGMGTAQGAPIPARDDFGQLKGYKKDKSGNVVLSKVNVNFMKELASAGKGAYYHATFSGDEIRQIETDLDKLEKTEFESDFLRKYDERFQTPLIFAFIILLLEMLLTERSSQARRRR